MTPEQNPLTWKVVVMSLSKKTFGWTALIVVLVAVIGAGVLWKMDKLPLGGSTSGDVVAAGADSTAVDGDKKDEDEKDPKDVSVPVQLARAERRGIDAYYKAASVVEADRLVDLVTKMQGRVSSVNVEEGDWVSSGQILAELENGRERVQLRQADLKLEDQKRLLERNQAMLEENLISEQEFDVARSAHDLAEAERDLARITFEETTLRAPFAGQVTERKIVAGQLVNVSEALFTLADFSPLRVRVYLPENVASKVSAGQRVLVTPDALGVSLEAKVERVSPVVDPVTSTVRVTLRLDDGDALARVGGFVKVRITTDSHTDALAVPKLALAEEGGLRSLFVAEADSVRKVEIRTGLYDEDFVEILDGVEEGWFVVEVGQGGLRDGTRIEPINGAEVGWDALFQEDSVAKAEAESVLARAE